MIWPTKEMAANHYAGETARVRKSFACIVYRSVLGLRPRHVDETLEMTR